MTVDQYYKSDQINQPLMNQWLLSEGKIVTFSRNYVLIKGNKVDNDCKQKGYLLVE